MKTTIVGTGADVGPLDALRATLAEADEAILCSAFVNRAGVHLVEGELSDLHAQGRVIVTSVFGGASTATAMTAIQDTGARLRVVNPSRGTFHPKAFVARQGSHVRALVGSANLTSGLVTNVEIGVLLEGRRDEPALESAWSIASALWSHESAQIWQPLAAEGYDEAFAPDLLRALQHAVRTDPVFHTLRDGKPNRVVDVTRSGLWVETEASLPKRRPAQEIPAWMFTLAHDYLRENGELTNGYLVADDGLNVKRSSAVCAILARLPGVEVAARSPITLRWRS